MGLPANDDEPDRLAIDEADLAAYARDALDAAGRRRVEGFLACNPDLAARTMAERHLSGAAPRTPNRRLISFVLAVAMLLGVLVSALVISWRSAQNATQWREADGDAAPAYIQEAVESQQATLLRAAMSSQPEETRLDAPEIQKAMRIHLPTIPAGWTVLNVQVYPSDQGPSVQLWLQAPDARRLSLFAVRADTIAGPQPEYASDGVHGAVFWEVGRSAFVLLGEGSRRELMGEARILSAGARS